MTGSQGPISSTPGYMSTSTPMGGLAARERETELRQLLSDCEALISTYSTDLMNRSDRYGTSFHFSRFTSKSITVNAWNIVSISVQQF